jgi:membrane-bound serine protease (ClpP class)
MFRLIIRFSYIVLFILALVFSFISEKVSAETTGIEILSVDGTIVPVIADYIDRGITAAEEKNSICIIELNTPGGLLDTTEKIVQRILNAKVPIVVYVSPHGSWAASAGTFITIAAHVAVMAPGTTIGAAHPVSGSGQEIPEDVAKKATEYSAAWIRSIADLRGRNPDQAELAVKESKSFTVTQALENNLIDFQADSLDSLIQQLHGRKVALSDNKQVELNTVSTIVARNEMTGIERFLQVLSNPNLAYILLSLATIGLITEISNPGLIFPGVVGGLSLLIAFYSLGTLNAYWAGLLLFMLALGLFVAEIFTPTFGILTAGGIISLIIGSLMLFSNNPPVLAVNPGLIAAVVVVLAAFFIFVIGAIVRGQRRRAVTGIEALVGMVAEAKSALDPKGTVIVDGERWSARVDDGRVEPGEEVIVTKVDGLKLIVAKKKT